MWKSYVILSIRYIPRNSIGTSYRLQSIYIDSIWCTYRIHRYITDRQNYIGFTNKSPINLLYLVIFINCLSICAPAREAA